VIENAVCNMYVTAHSRIYAALSGFPPVAVNTGGCVTMHQDFSPCVGSIPSPICVLTLSSHVLYESDEDL